MAGNMPVSGIIAYSAAKAAVHNLSKNLAREWAEHDIRVNTLVPGFFPSAQASRQGDEIPQRIGWYNLKEVLQQNDARLRATVARGL